MLIEYVGYFFGGRIASSAPLVREFYSTNLFRGFGRRNALQGLP